MYKINYHAVTCTEKYILCAADHDQITYVIFRLL